MPKPATNSPASPSICASPNDTLARTATSQPTCQISTRPQMTTAFASTSTATTAKLYAYVARASPPCRGKPACPNRPGWPSCPPRATRSTAQQVRQVTRTRRHALQTRRWNPRIDLRSSTLGRGCYCLCPIPRGHAVIRDSLLVGDHHDQPASSNPRSCRRYRCCTDCLRSVVANVQQPLEHHRSRPHCCHAILIGGQRLRWPDKYQHQARDADHIQHTFPSAFAVMLVGPSGARIILYG